MVQSVNGLVDKFMDGVKKINENKQMIFELTNENQNLERLMVREAVEKQAYDFLMLNKSAIIKIQRYSKR